MAVISPVRIANMAISHLGGKSTIETLTENTPEGKIMELWYDYSRLEALEAYDWRFARKRLLMAEHSEDPPAGVWGFRYQYPSDCVSAREIENPLGPDADAIPFEVEMNGAGGEKTILTDAEKATLVYTFDQPNTTFFSAHFVSTLSYLLAHHTAYSVTRKAKLRNNMFLIFRDMIRVAPAVDANEGARKPPREAESVRARA
jgi:hypothetical protein